MVATQQAKGKFMLELIDAHLHFFDLDKGDYRWLKAETHHFGQISL